MSKTDILPILAAVPCDLKKVRGRIGVYRCARKGCTHPPLRMPPHPRTGRPLNPSEFVPPQCLAPPEIPSLLRRAVLFARAWTRHILHGLPATPEHMLAQRLALCHACPHLTSKGGCEKCGCPITTTQQLRSKLSMATERCPLTPPKWDRVELAPTLGIRGWLNRLVRKVMTGDL